jgi:hypothetical protein
MLGWRGHLLCSCSEQQGRAPKTNWPPVSGSPLGASAAPANGAAYAKARRLPAVLTTDDGAGVTTERAVSLTAVEETEILLVDLGRTAAEWLAVQGSRKAAAAMT